MDDNNKNINDPNKDNLDSTRKFNINDISRTLDNDGKVDNPSKATTNPSDFFKRGGSLVDSHSINEQESPKDVFDEIFDSQKKATDSFEDTLLDLPVFTDKIDPPVSESENQNSNPSSETIISADIPVFSDEKQKDYDSASEILEADTLNKPPKEKKKKKKKSFFKSNAWFVIRTLFLIFLCTTLICTIALVGYMLSLDDVVDLDIEASRLNEATVIYYMDENGDAVEYDRLYLENRTWVPLENIPEHLQNAAIAIEDHRFREHNGVDWKRTLGASYNLFFKTQGSFGASTITQQLVKNLTGDNQDSVKRKLQEMMRAQYLEEHYDKDTILEHYLNTIFLGESCYGVGTAAHAYFGKDVSELTLAESAAIIGITNLPTYYNPYINPENNQKRCHTIINRMYELGMISEQEKNDALNEKLVFKSGDSNGNPDEIKSYFVDQIIEQLLVDLTEECGYSESKARHLIYSGGLKIYSTIKPEVQTAMDEVFLLPSEEDKNAVFTKLPGLEQPQCAMVLIDPQNGNVVAIRGGRGEKTGNRVFNYATHAKRAPGSTIKPISVYAPAMQYGLITPFTPEDDAPIIFFKNEEEKNNADIPEQDSTFVAVNPGQAGKCYPNNENDKFSGRTNILEGVKESMNTISMRTLNKLGLDKSYNFLSANLRLSNLSPTKDKNFAPLALGQIRATVLEMAAAYVPFANGGTYYEPRFYTKVVDNNGNVLIDKETPSKVDSMSKKTATYMNYTLQQVVESGTGKSAKLSTGVPVGGKTGTSSNNKDFWFVGYTPYYVGATWYGYDIEKYLGEASRQAIKPWKAVMEAVHADLPVKDFEKNKDFESVEICSKSGLLPSEDCYNDPRGSQVITGYFHKDDVPKKKCDIHESITIDKTTNMPATDYCPRGNKTSRVYMSLNRYHNVADGVVLADEAYVIHSGELPNGMFRFSGKNRTSAVDLNKTCSTHAYAPKQPIEAEVSDESDSDDSSESTSDESGDIVHDASSDAPSIISKEETSTDSEESDGSDEDGES